MCNGGSGKCSSLAADYWNWGILKFIFLHSAESLAQSDCMYHSVPWFCLYQAREMQIHYSTSLSIYITMKRQSVFCFYLHLLLFVCDKTLFICKRSILLILSDYHVPQFHTELLVAYQSMLESWAVLEGIRTNIFLPLCISTCYSELILLSNRWMDCAVFLNENKVVYLYCTCHCETAW